jgi:hypothetical protein
MVSHLFFAAEPDPALRRGLISVLAGDVWRRDNPFQNDAAGARAYNPRRRRWPLNRTNRRELGGSGLMCNTHYIMY